MSSSQPFQASSPLSPAHASRRKSQFTYRHLSQLSNYSAASPLRVIAHIDLDAFYAQCEMVRLGIGSDQPLAVRQWQGLIAINYPARAFGLTRHITATEARLRCPQLIMQHVATWKEGDAKWAYHEDADAHIGTHKVALDPYRAESRRILACIVAALPQRLRRVEKASVDEVFLDLSAQVHAVLLERYPELRLPAPYDDPTECLPRPPTTVLDWKADALVDLDGAEKEEDDPDWDDIAMLIGSEIVRDIRAAVKATLKYTCSAGIAHNKMLAKLGSGFRKPNQQTVIRNRAVQQFLSEFKFTKIRNLGGKLGDQIVVGFNTDTVKELLSVSLDRFKQKLGDDTGSWVYQTIRGIDFSEVNPRTQIKSMLSAKSFRPSINSYEQAARWLRIFVSDIYSRLVEEGVLENKRRPKTMNLHHRQGGQTRSRQIPISQGRTIDEIGLFDLAKTLLRQVITEGQVWPCANLSLSVGGFEEAITGNMGIGAFLVKAEEAKINKSSANETEGVMQSRPEKRQKLEKSAPGIKSFFRSESLEEHDDEFGAQQAQEETHNSPGNVSESDGHKAPECTSPRPVDGPRFHQLPVDAYFCTRCHCDLESAEAFQSHADWHFAKDLQDEERIRPVAGAPARTSSAAGKRRAAASTKKTASAAVSRIEKGQSKLSFG